MHRQTIVQTQVVVAEGNRKGVLCLPKPVLGGPYPAWHQTKDGPDSQPIFEEKMTGSEIDVRGQLASAWIRYKAKFGSESHLMEWSGTDLFTLIKDNNSWKIVSMAYITDH